MLEVETKFVLKDLTAFVEGLESGGAIRGDVERHSDTYYRHPCRDFVQTREAFRIRTINEVACVTYKGPKLDVGDSAMKARKEIEWCLAPADADGKQMTELLHALGFSPVTAVRKQRHSYRWPESSTHSSFTVTMDEVDEVGRFAEIELLVDEGDPDAVTEAGRRIEQLADSLGLTETVQESYLELLLGVRERGGS